MKRRFSWLLVLVALLGVAAMAEDPPTWWNGNGTISAQPTGPDEPTPSLDAWMNQSDDTPVTYGQLKTIATNARDYLDAVLVDSGGAGATIDNAVAALTDPATAPDDSTPATQAQLQAIAQPFYDRLLAAGFDVKASLIANGLGADWASNYPWSPPPTSPDGPAYDATAYTAWQQQQDATASLGQLKLDFGFDLNTYKMLVADPNGGPGRFGSGSPADTTANAGADGQNIDPANSAAAASSANSTLVDALASQPAVQDNSELALVVLTPLE